MQRYATVRIVMQRYAAVRSGTLRYAAVRCGTLRYAAVRCGTQRLFKSETLYHNEAIELLPNVKAKIKENYEAYRSLPISMK